MTAKVVIGFFVALKRRSDPKRSRFLTLKKPSMMYFPYFTITFFISLLPFHSMEM